MSKFMKYFMRGAAIASLLAVKVPVMVADGKITVAEMADFMTSVLDVGGWKGEIEVPEQIAGVSLKAVIE